LINRNIFYHFVGAVPDSTNLYKMLVRLLIELGVIKVRTTSYLDKIRMNRFVIVLVYTAFIIGGFRWYFNIIEHTNVFVRNKIILFNSTGICFEIVSVS